MLSAYVDTLVLSIKAVVEFVFSFLFYFLSVLKETIIYWTATECKVL